MNDKLFLCWVFSLIFTCVKAQTTLFEEDFEGGIPSTFQLYSDGYIPNDQVAEYTDAWIAKTDPENSNNTTASATSYFSQPQMAQRWLITPAITLGSSDNVLSWVAKSYDASFAESYLVLLSTTNTDKNSFTDTLTSVFNEQTDWTHRWVDLSEGGYDGKTVHVAFVLITIDGFKFFLDSLSVTSDTPPNTNPPPQPPEELPSIPNPSLGIKTTMAHVNMNIYPNPTTEFISIKTDIAPEKIFIRTMEGKICRTSQQTNIYVADLADGLYFIEAQFPTGTLTQRFIKK